MKLFFFFHGRQRRTFLLRPRCHKPMHFRTHTAMPSAINKMSLELKKDKVRQVKKTRGRRMLMGKGYRARRLWKARVTFNWFLNQLVCYFHDCTKFTLKQCKGIAKYLWSYENTEPRNGSPEPLTCVLLHSRAQNRINQNFRIYFELQSRWMCIE